MTVSKLYLINQNNRDLLPSRIRLLESYELPVNFRTRAFVLQALQTVLRKPNIDQEGAVTTMQELWTNSCRWPLPGGSGIWSPPTYDRYRE